MEETTKLEKICCKTRQELADEYGLSSKTITKYLKLMGLEVKNRRLAPKEVRAFYEHHGRP